MNENRTVFQLAERSYSVTRGLPFGVKNALKLIVIFSISKGLWCFGHPISIRFLIRSVQSTGNREHGTAFAVYDYSENHKSLWIKIEHCGLIVERMYKTIRGITYKNTAVVIFDCDSDNFPSTNTSKNIQLRTYSWKIIRQKHIACGRSISMTTVEFIRMYRVIRYNYISPGRYKSESGRMARGPYRIRTNESWVDFYCTFT